MILFMKKNKSLLKRHILILAFLAIAGISCDAPKNNPLHSSANSTPVVTDFSVYSVVTNRYTLPRIYQFVVQAKILDRNDMVDTVFVDIPYFKVRKNLEFNLKSHSFERTLSLLDLHTTKADEAVGQNFSILIKDIASRIYEVKTGSIKRIIRDEITIDKPLGGDTTETKPLLSWKPFEGEFTHSFFIQIFTYESIPQLVWEKENISSDSLSVRVDTPLPKGEYVWEVWCIDQFKNRASSKPATFKVQ
jgi:hypothetical protein